MLIIQIIKLMTNFGVQLPDFFNAAQQLNGA
jgi:hypothetical protein